MPNRFAVIVVIAALASATTISVTGQQEPRPRVTPRGAATAPVSTEEVREAAPGDFWRGDLLVVLPSDPIHQSQPVTLADAARNNDYATFHTLYLAAREQGRDVSAFTTLHDVWTYSVTNPVGAFYGRETMGRLARSYPGFAAFIEQYRIVDNRGNVFYPTAETRTFLLQQAVQGTTPTAVVTLPSSPAVTAGESDVSTRPATRRSTASRTTAPSRSTATPRSSSVAADAKPVVTAPAVTPSRSTTAARRPAIAVRRVQPPVDASRTAAPAQQPVSSPATTEALVGQTPSPAATPALTEVASPTDAKPVETASPATTVPVTSAPTAGQQPISSESGTGRGLLLLIIGLMGVGILALMLRTPREEVPQSIIDHSAAPPSGEPETKQANVEPIRKRTGNSSAPHRRTRTGA